ncbi:hypothetical protein JCM10213_008224 [Rhodosporidiobolus nylandii]
MAEFDYADLVDEGMLGYNPSPVFHSPIPQQPFAPSPLQSGQSTPARGGRGRGGFTPRGRGRGGSQNQSGASSPASSFAGTPSRGRGRGAGLLNTLAGGRGNHGGLGAFNARGRGGGRGGLGTSSPRGGHGNGVVGLPGSGGGGGLNPLLVPVKFVPAQNKDFGTVGGEDEHGLEKAGAEAPQPSKDLGAEKENEQPKEWQLRSFSPAQAEEGEGDRSLDGVLADEVSRLGLVPSQPPAAYPAASPKSLAEVAAEPEPFEPEPHTTATMALDEIEDEDAVGESAPARHPGLGAKSLAQCSDDDPETGSSAFATAQAASPLPPSSARTASPSPAPGDDDAPLFFSDTTGSLPGGIVTDLPPPIPLVTHDVGEDEVLASSGEEEPSSEDDEEIVYSRRAVAHADPVSLSRAAPAPPSIPISRPAPTPAPAPAPAPPAKTAGLSKKQLKRSSRAARKAGKQHARSGNAHLLTSSADGGARLGGFSDEEEALEKQLDREDGAALFARLNAGGSGGMDDMLAAASSSEDDAAAAMHEDGDPRVGDSDLDWGDGPAPPPRKLRGKEKKAAQRSQREAQRESEKLDRLVAAGGAREEVELTLAIEESLREEERAKALRRAERRRRDEARAEEDYLAQLAAAGEGEEGDDSIAVMTAFARGVPGMNNSGHHRGDDADRRLIEELEEEDEWGTSEGSEEDESAEETELDSEEETELDSEEEYERQLGLEEESSEEVDSDVELEMDYSLGDADGRVEHSLSLASTSGSSFDSSLSSSTDSDAELYAFEASLLAGQKIRLSSVGVGGPGGRRDERERKKERRRERKGKGKAREFVEESEDSSDGDEALFQGQDSWAERDEDFIERMQRTVALNADLLQTAQGGKAARRANRKERNKLFRAIEQGDFDAYDDLDDEVEAMLMEEEEGNGWGAAGPSKKQRKKDKTFNGAFSAQLAAQWDTDRSKKAAKKAERAALRAADFEAARRDEYRPSPRGGKGKKARIAAAAEGEQVNDAATVNARIMQFVKYDISNQSMSLPPMGKKARIAVHLLAEVYGLKSKSLGSGKNRFPVLERTQRTTLHVSQARVRAIVGTADGENELEDGYERWGGLGRGGRPKGGKMLGLWKALEGASGKKGGRSGGGGMGRNHEGAVVGQGADKLGEDNVGFALLKKMGWTEGATIGQSSNAILEPIAARVKTNKGGLGSGYAVSRSEAQKMARGPK